MEAKNVPAGEESELDLQLKARRLVRHYYNHTVVPQGEQPLVLINQVYIVWFSKVLGNWKAMVGTVNNDGLYFEVTHDGAQNLTYVDMYEKQGQMIEGPSANLIASGEVSPKSMSERRRAAEVKLSDIHTAAVHAAERMKEDWGYDNLTIAKNLGISESSVRFLLK